MQQMEEHAKNPQDQTNEEDYRKSTLLSSLVLYFNYIIV